MFYTNFELTQHRCRISLLNILFSALAYILSTIFAGAVFAAGLVPPAATQTSGDRTVGTMRAVLPEIYRLQVEVEGLTRGGTAFLVSGRRIVATSNHVVEHGIAFWLGYLDASGNVKRIPMRILATYPQKDLALLEALDDLPGSGLPLATATPEAAEGLFAIGFPAAADPLEPLTTARMEDVDESFYVPSVLKGYVSRVLPNRWLTTQLQHQTPIVPGYSGGPLVDATGSVVAVSTSVHKTANGISYGVLASDLAEFAEACNIPVRANQGIARLDGGGQADGKPPATVNTYSVAGRPPVVNSARGLTGRPGAFPSPGGTGDRRATGNRRCEDSLCILATHDGNGPTVSCEPKR